MGHLSLEHVGVAFAMVFVAGMATALGGAAVCCERLVKLADKRNLAAALAFSGGIMLYVAFIEIFQKAKGGFEDAGVEENHAYMASTLCLFSGMLLMRLLGVLVHALAPDLDDHAEEAEDPKASEEARNNPHADMAGQDPKALRRMGLSTMAAITIHNFPEGIAGLVAGLIDPAVGFTLCMAITIHNIPEGLCIAMPIYYSTGSRVKGFLFALLSGLSEPVGALIAWGVVAASGQDMHGTVYGVLFGMVAGIMIMIVCHELLPVAHKYDPQDKVVTTSLAAGMLVMATSLVLFVA